MRSLKIALLAGAAIAAAFTSANAADLGPIMQAPRMIQPAQVEEMTGGWYLRGDIGVGAQNFKEFDHTQTNQAFVWPASWRIDQRDINDTAFVGFGVGYVWNSWLRFDATAEYRTKSKFNALGSYTEARAEWALYANGADLPYRGRALDHIEAIDALRKAPPPAPAITPVPRRYRGATP